MVCFCSLSIILSPRYLKTFRPHIYPKSHILLYHTKQWISIVMLKFSRLIFYSKITQKQLLTHFNGLLFSIPYRYEILLYLKSISGNDMLFIYRKKSFDKIRFLGPIITFLTGLRDISSKLIG